MDEDTISALINTISIIMEDIPNSRGPFLVYDWMLERFPDEVQSIAKNMFNGEIVVIPKKYEGE